MKKHFDNVILCLSNHLQPPSDGWNGARVYDRTWPSVHSFRRRTFDDVVWIL